MAWSPKTFDITKINNGNRYKGGDGIQSSAINAAIESAAYAQALAVQEPNTKNVDKVGTPSVSIEIYDGLPRLKFENLKGEKGDDHNLEINDLYTRVEENARQINTVKQVMVQNEQVVMLPLVDSFKTRITAKGANIFDEQYTPVSTVEGNTVVDKSSNSFKNAYFKGITSTGKNLFNILSNFESNQYTVSGNTLTILDSAENCYVGCTYKLPAGNYFLSGIGGSIAIESYVNGVVTNPVYGAILTSGISFTVPENAELVRIFFYATVQGGGSYEKIMLNFGDTALPFEPYVEDTLELPTAVDCGLGTTLDLENRKIINRGVEITITGNELVAFKNYAIEYPSVANGKALYVLYFSDIMPTKEDRAVGVSTDGVVVPNAVGTAYWVKGGLWLGVGDRHIYWLDVANYLGLSYNSSNWTDKLNPTVDEQNLTIEYFKAYLKQRYESGNPVKIRYVASTGTETALGAGVLSSYKAWKNGTETIIQGDIDNSEYGANPKITQTYIAKVGGEE